MSKEIGDSFVLGSCFACLSKWQGPSIESATQGCVKDAVGTPPASRLTTGCPAEGGASGQREHVLL